VLSSKSTKGSTGTQSNLSDGLALILLFLFLVVVFGSSSQNSATTESWTGRVRRYLTTPFRALARIWSKLLGSPSGNRFKKARVWELLLINTVHDDIEADVDNNPDLVYNTCIEMEKAFQIHSPSFREDVWIEHQRPNGRGGQVRGKPE
jgi:hypothetical protein